MSENPFAKFRPTAPSKAGSGNPFAKFKNAPVAAPAGQQTAMPRPVVAQTMGAVEPQTVNIADKVGIDPASQAMLAMGNQYSPVTQGITLGSSDEIFSGLAAPIDSVVNALTGRGPTSVSENYAQRKAQMETEKAAYERDNPKTAIAGELAGGLLTGGIGGKFIQGGKSLLGVAGRSSVVGGGIGGTQGFMGTDGDLESRSKGALVGGGVGAVLGGTLPPVFSASRALVGSAMAPVRSLANPKAFAARKVAESVGRDGMSLPRLEGRLRSNSALKSDLALADVAGGNTADLLRAASNVPSKARQSLVQQLEYRQANQLKRLQKDIGSAFGNPQDFHKATEALVMGRKSAAKPLFEQAFQTPTPYSFELENVLKRPLTKQLVERARIAAANRGENFKNVLIDVADDGTATARRVIDTEGLHRVKMTIDEMLNGLKRGEPTGLDNVNMRDLTILKKDLMGAIDNQPYKAALAQYAGDSAVVNALDDGFENGLKMDPELIAKQLSSLSPSEQKMWRLGFARSVSDSLRDAGRQGANRADILMSPKFMQRLEAAIPDVRSRRDLLQAIKLEQRMARTRSAVQGNSTTAKQLAQGQEAGVEAQDTQDLMLAARDIGSGNFFGAAMKYIGRAKNTATGLRPEVADEIIRLMTTRKPDEIRKAAQMVNKQALIIAKKGGRRDLFNGLRAVSAGLLSGRLGESLAAPPKTPQRVAR